MYICLNVTFSRRKYFLGGILFGLMNLIRAILTRKCSFKASVKWRCCINVLTKIFHHRSKRFSPKYPNVADCNTYVTNILMINVTNFWRVINDRIQNRKLFWNSCPSANYMKIKEWIKFIVILYIAATEMCVFIWISCSWSS